MRSKYLILIPTYNEKKNINLILGKINKKFNQKNYILFVDDNSNDGTSNIVRKYTKKDRRVRLINRLGRSGLSSAIKEGCLCASGEIIFIMDSDG